jgi:hypothetical protein
MKPRAAALVGCATMAVHTSGPAWSLAATPRLRGREPRQPASLGFHEDHSAAVIADQRTFHVGAVYNGPISDRSWSGCLSPRVENP